jgi:hypothetical protein
MKSSYANMFKRRHLSLISFYLYRLVFMAMRCKDSENARNFPLNVSYDASWLRIAAPLMKRIIRKSQTQKAFHISFLCDDDTNRTVRKTATIVATASKSPPPKFFGKEENVSATFRAHCLSVLSNLMSEICYQAYIIS